MLFLLLSCWIIAGITAVNPPVWKYGVKNSSICLKVGKSPPYLDVKWRFNNTVVVFNGNITPKYTDKVIYDRRDHSLCINKLTENDVGIYFVTIIRNYLESTESYRLIVEETVPRPALHFNQSGGLCNITVNCSIQDDWVWSVCDEDSCRTSQRSIFNKVNITVFTDSRSIVCIGNNNVSTSNVSESTEAMCFRKSNPEHEESSESPTLIVIAVVFAVCVFAFVVCLAKWLCSPRYNHQWDQTTSAQLTQNQPMEAQLQPAPRVSTSSSSQAEASYENVDATRPCQTSTPVISPRVELESKQSQKVDTIYSFVQVPNATSSLDKSDSIKGDKELQEPSASHYVTLDKEEHPVQIDTVYSVLQKPNNLKSQHHQ